MNEEEIIKGLRFCADTDCHCEECPYADTQERICIDNLFFDAANAVESQQSRIAELEKQLSESRTEIEQRNLAGDFAYVIGQFTSSQGENGRLKGENRKLKKELAESQRREKAAVDFIKYLDRNYSRYIAENEKFEPWRGPQDEKGE